MQLGCPHEGESFFWWLLHASQLTNPRLRVLYRLNGGERAPEANLPLAGYRGSRPVRVGNGAADQEQLDIYGDLMQTAWIYAVAIGALDADTGRRLAQIAESGVRTMGRPDCGIWECQRAGLQLHAFQDHVWVALDRRGGSPERGGRHPGISRGNWRAGRGDPEVRRRALLVAGARSTYGRQTAMSSMPACCWAP